MLKLFGGGKSDHPMATIKEARDILEAVPANDPHKALEELAHWHESVRAAEGFKPEYRAQLVQMIDDGAQAHARRLAREYLSTRLSKFQEGRIRGAILQYWGQAVLAFGACLDLYAGGAKGADALKQIAPLLAARALRALAAQTKWLYVRYGPLDSALWAQAGKILLFAEARKFSKSKVTVYPGVPGESTPEEEFLRAVMLSVSSPDGLLPVEMELAERVIVHFSAHFDLAAERQPDAAYWVDLAAGVPPQRLARAPQAAPGVRYVSASRAAREIEQLIQRVKSANAVPSDLALGATYAPDVVIGVLEHLAMYWSPRLPERQATRHKVKSRLTVAHGFDGVLGMLEPSSSLDFEAGATESWIVDNVSTGGFGAVVPEIKGDWLKIGCLLAMQPEGGNNWLIGVIRRFSRESQQQGMVGIQTLAKSAHVIPVRIAAVSDTGILLDPLAQSTRSETYVLLRAGAMIEGRNIETEVDGRNLLLLPAGVADTGDDYERWRFKQMVREAGE